MVAPKKVKVGKEMLMIKATLIKRISQEKLKRKLFISAQKYITYLVKANGIRKVMAEIRTIFLKEIDHFSIIIEAKAIPKIAVVKTMAKFSFNGPKIRLVIFKKKS